MDYEIAMWRASSEVFKDGVELHGCFFHYTQAVWRKIQALGKTIASNFSVTYTNITVLYLLSLHVYVLIATVLIHEKWFTVLVKKLQITYSSRCTFYWQVFFLLTTFCFWLRSGLATAYRTGRRTYRVMRKLLVLPLLPATHMRAAFDDICSRVDDEDTLLTSLQAYVRQTWLDNSTWTPSSVSVYGQQVLIGFITQMSFALIFITLSVRQAIVNNKLHQQNYI